MSGASACCAAKMARCVNCSASSRARAPARRARRGSRARRTRARVVDRLGHRQAVAAAPRTRAGSTRGRRLCPACREARVQPPDADQHRGFVVRRLERARLRVERGEQRSPASPLRPSSISARARFVDALAATTGLGTARSGERFPVGAAAASSKLPCAASRFPRLLSAEAAIAGCWLCARARSRERSVRSASGIAAGWRGRRCRGCSPRPASKRRRAALLRKRRGLLEPARVPPGCGPSARSASAAALHRGLPSDASGSGRRCRGQCSSAAQRRPRDCLHADAASWLPPPRAEANAARSSRQQPSGQAVRGRAANRIIPPPCAGYCARPCFAALPASVWCPLPWSSCGRRGRWQGLELAVYDWHIRLRPAAAQPSAAGSAGHRHRAGHPGARHLADARTRCSPQVLERSLAAGAQCDRAGHLPRCPGAARDTRSSTPCCRARPASIGADDAAARAAGRASLPPAVAEGNRAHRLYRRRRRPRRHGASRLAR